MNIKVSLNKSRFKKEKLRSAEESGLVDHISNVIINMIIGAAIMLFSVLLYNSVIKEGYFGIGQIVKALFANALFTLSMFLLLKMVGKLVGQYSEAHINSVLLKWTKYICGVPVSAVGRTFTFNKEGISVHEDFYGAGSSFYHLDWSSITGVVTCGKEFIALYVDPDVMKKTFLNTKDWFKGIIINNVYDGLDSAELMKMCKENTGISDSAFLDFPESCLENLLAYMKFSNNIEELAGYSNRIKADNSSSEWFENMKKDIDQSISIHNADLMKEFTKCDDLMQELYLKWTGTKKEYENYINGNGDLPKDMSIVDGKVHVGSEEAVANKSEAETQEKSNESKSGELDSYKFENK